jgi:hypothetical protein
MEIPNLRPMARCRMEGAGLNVRSHGISSLNLPRWAPLTKSRSHSSALNHSRCHLGCRLFRLFCWWSDSSLQPSGASVIATRGRCSLLSRAFSMPRRGFRSFFRLSRSRGTLSLPLRSLCSLPVSGLGPIWSRRSFLWAISFRVGMSLSIGASTPDKMRPPNASDVPLTPKPETQ